MQIFTVVNRSFIPGGLWSQCKSHPSGLSCSRAEAARGPYTFSIRCFPLGTWWRPTLEEVQFQEFRVGKGICISYWLPGDSLVQGPHLENH